MVYANLRKYLGICKLFLCTFVKSPLPYPGHTTKIKKMQTVLFHSTIFGPIHSRRLGVSLGVNLTPNDGKVCTFDCLYCEAGFNAQGTGTTGLPSRGQVAADLEQKLRAMHEAGERLDVITFSGNGEPTMHPEFEAIIDDTLQLRDKYYPQAKVSVLSNATCLGSESVRRALRRVDNDILKLDSAIEATVKALDRPVRPSYNVATVIEQIAEMAPECIVQTMLLRGEHDGVRVDNTTDEEIAALIEAYRRIKPREVMIYSIDRKTPAERLHRVEREELQTIAARITAETGIPVQVA